MLYTLWKCNVLPWILLFRFGLIRSRRKSDHSYRRNMTRFIMSLDEAVDLVDDYAFEHGENGDLLIYEGTCLLDT